MSWHLRHQPSFFRRLGYLTAARQHGLLGLLSAGNLSLPPLTEEQSKSLLRAIKQIRPVKPIAPFGLEYYWLD